MSDTTHDTRRKRTHRGNRKPAQRPCSREGCQGRTRGDNKYCGFVCKVVSAELNNAQRICEYLGVDTPMISELWAEAVALSDCWSRYLELDRRLYKAAVEVGINDEQ